MLMPTPVVLDLAREGVRALGAAEERHRRHAHDKIVGLAGHDAAHRIQHVGADDLGAGAESSRC